MEHLEVFNCIGRKYAFLRNAENKFTVQREVHLQWSFSIIALIKAEFIDPIAALSTFLSCLGLLRRPNFDVVDVAVDCACDEIVLSKLQTLHSNSYETIDSLLFQDMGSWVGLTADLPKKSVAV